ncbi:MAG TPA: HTTM domain-containing protein, partial [bacterium]|nr:HTTM domain-containing protein [bacterium]
MIAKPDTWKDSLGMWLNFWFTPVSMAQLAAMRIGTGLILLFTLFVGSFDLEAHFSVHGWGSLAALQQLDPMEWPFSVLGWFSNSFWLWSVHVLAMLVALAFILGILPTWSGALNLVFLLSYAHRNPAVQLSLDDLLFLAIFYLALTPCGRMVAVLRGWGLQWLADPALEPGAPAQPAWSGFPMRLLQVHLCLLYFSAGLAKLSPDWLAGVVFWHPRMAEAGLPLGLATLQATPQLSAFVIYGVILFQLFFPVFIWVPRFRYVTLGVALIMHLAVGLAWGSLPLNLLMLVLDLSFVRPQHVNGLAVRLADAVMG